MQLPQAFPNEIVDDEDTVYGNPKVIFGKISTNMFSKILGEFLMKFLEVSV